MGKSKAYHITFHFDNTTLSSYYDTEEEMETAFRHIEQTLGNNDVLYYRIPDTIINLRKVICITKGETDIWKSASKH